MLQATLYTNKFKKIGVLSDIISLTAVRTVNGIGICVIEIPVNTKIPFNVLIQEDLGLLIEIKKDKRLVPLMDTFWFLIEFDEIITDKQKIFRLQFEDTIGLLARKLNAYKKDSTQAEIKGFTAGAMQRLVQNNYSPLAIPNRQVLQIAYAPISYISPEIQKSASFSNILSTLNQMSRTSKEKGNQIFFDLLVQPQIGNINFNFTTYINQRGADKTNTVINTDNPFFSLNQFKINYDIASSAYIGGEGNKEDQIVVQEENSRASSGIFTRREIFKTVQSSNPTVLRDEAKQLISRGGIITLQGQLLGKLADTFNLGDRLKIQHRDFLVECEIKNERWELRDKVLSKQVNVKSLE